jgi:hypothetical protein
VKMIRHGQSYWWSPIVPADKSLQIEQQTYDIYRPQEQHLNPKMLVLNYDILVVVELCTIYYIILILYYHISYARLYIIYFVSPESIGVGSSERTSHFTLPFPCQALSHIQKPFIQSPLREQSRELSQTCGIPTTIGVRNIIRKMNVTIERCINCIGDKSEQFFDRIRRFRLSLF